MPKTQRETEKEVISNSQGGKGGQRQEIVTV